MILVNYRGLRPRHGNVTMLTADKTHQAVQTEPTTISEAYGTHGRFRIEEFDTYELVSGSATAKDMVLALLNINHVEELRLFIMRYGFPKYSLKNFSRSKPINTLEIDLLMDWITLLREFREFCHDVSDGDKSRGIATSETIGAVLKSNDQTWIELVANKESRIMEPRLYVRDLVTFSILEIAWFGQLGQSFKVCANSDCARIFLPKAKAKKGTRCCSDNCRKQYNRTKKKQNEANL